MGQHDEKLPADQNGMEEYEPEGTIHFCGDSFLQRSSLDLARHLLSIHLSLVPRAVFMGNGVPLVVFGH
jgi:hypothetical protein